MKIKPKIKLIEIDTSGLLHGQFRMCQAKSAVSVILKAFALFIKINSSMVFIQYRIYASSNQEIS